MTHLKPKLINFGESSTKGEYLKFAISNNERVEAAPGRTGTCIGCSSPMVAKCGDINVWHWAHKNEKKCDPWWEKETEWHRSWKALYPPEWQEVVHYSESGEKHIADVKTNLGWVVEIQHSYLNPNERKSREEFYKKLIWIVDGKRRKLDGKKFVEAIKRSNVISKNPLFITKLTLNDCKLIKEWEDSDAPVFFDFGDRIRSGYGETEIVWWLLPKDQNGKRNWIMLEPKLHLAQRLRDDSSRVRDFEAVVNEFRSIVTEREFIEQKNRAMLDRRKSLFNLA